MLSFKDQIGGCQAWRCARLQQFLISAGHEEIAIVELLSGGTVHRIVRAQAVVVRQFRARSMIL